MQTARTTSRSLPFFSPPPSVCLLFSVLRCLYFAFDSSDNEITNYGPIDRCRRTIARSTLRAMQLLRGYALIISFLSITFNYPLRKIILRLYKRMFS